MRERGDAADCCPPSAPAPPVLPLASIRKHPKTSNANNHSRERLAR